MQRRFFVILCAVILPALYGLCLTAPADAADVPPALKGFRLKESFIPRSGKPVGLIQSTTGQVVVAREDRKEGYYATPGDRLYEKDSIYTLREARCRFKLNGEDVVTMGEDTRIAIKSFTEDRRRGVKRSDFQMVNGKAMFYALKLLRYKGTAMSVETPTAIVGVRGTKFGAEVNPVVAERGRPQFATTVHGFEGRVEVFSPVDRKITVVSAGQSVGATPKGLGVTVPTPPAVAQKFKADTEAPPPVVSKAKTEERGSQAPPGKKEAAKTEEKKGDKKEEKKDQQQAQQQTQQQDQQQPQQPSGDKPPDQPPPAAPPTTDTLAGPGPTNPFTPITPDTSTVTQSQTTKTTEETLTDPVADPGPNATNSTASKSGYVAGMLTNQTSGILEEMFITTRRGDSDGRMWVRGSKDVTNDYSRVDGGGSFGEPYLNWVTFDKGTKKSGSVNLLISHSKLGETSNHDMDWGYWTETTPFTVSGTSYVLNNRGYYIFGPCTTNIPTSGLARYSGDAYGTYWSSSGGINMTGTFSCDINFSTSAISNILISVSGTNASASISGGSATVGSDGHFTISSDYWSLNGTTPTYKMAYGSLYRTSAEYIGGAWGMATSSEAAAGIYVSQKYDKPSTHYGHYVMMLKNSTLGLFDAFLMSTPSLGAQNLDSTSSAVDPLETNPSMSLNGTSGYITQSITALTTNGSVALTGGIPVQITRTEVGSNPYLEWGEWTQPALMTGGGNSFTFNNIGYYIAGDKTPDSKISDLATSASNILYSGTALGTYYTSAGGSKMTGSFDCKVNFMTGAVSNLNISVSNNDYEAKLTGGSGSLNTASGKKADFTITSATEVKLGAVGSSVTADKYTASGSIYGKEAQATGGVWAMKSTASSKQAVGIFQGLK